MPRPPFLSFQALKEKATAADTRAQACSCGLPGLDAWSALPYEFDQKGYQTVGTLIKDPFVEATFEEYHPGGTNNHSEKAPIAPAFYPYNRCDLSECKRCGRCFLQYTEGGGYYTEQKIRALNAQWLVDVPVNT